MNRTLAAVFALSLPLVTLAYEPGKATSAQSTEMPNELAGVGVTERLSQQLDLSLEFTNDEGERVPLGHYFNHGRPVLMAMVYYSCPNLCNFQLNGLIDVLKTMKGTPGKDYDLVAVSMDHKETADLAAKKKANYLKALQQPGAEKAWHFLVGSEANVAQLADQLGFKFKWNEDLKQYAHAAATYVLTPEGIISRYLYGIEFAAKTLRLSMVEASNGKIGNIIEQFTLFCFQFNPAKNKYTLYAFNLMRVGAALTVLVLAVILVPIWLRERQRKARQV